MKFNIFFIFPLFLILLSACEQVIDIKLPPHDPRLVVYSNIVEGDSSLVVWVGYTVGILDTTNLSGWSWFEEDSMKFSESAWVPNATVKIFENDVLLAELQPNSNLRVYQIALSSPLSASGKTYDLEVSAAGYPVATAKFVFPRAPEISNLRYEPLVSRDLIGNPMDRISFSIEDPIGLGDSYSFLTLVGFYDSFEQKWYEFNGYIMSNDPQLEDSYPNLVFTDVNNDGQTYPVQLLCYPIDTSNAGYGRLIVDAISKVEYFYIKSYQSYSNAVGNPFAEPVILYTNIENGRGLFIGRHRKKFNIVN